MTAALVLAFGSAYAVPITGTDGTGNNSAELTLVSSNGSQLLLDLENTSNFSAVITGFAFSLFDGLADTLISVTGTQDNGGWNFSSDADSGNGNATFNLDLESYAITGDSGNINGGDPNDGIAAGTTGRFTFSGQFGGNVGISDVFARWQRTGVDGDGSDYGWGCTDDPCMKVSEPASLTLFGLGLVFAGVAARRRRQQI
jgi:hypothetical protein